MTTWLKRLGALALGAALVMAWGKPVVTQQAVLLFGSSSGAPQVINSTSNALNVVLAAASNISVTSGTFSTYVILGAADTSSIRLDLESGTLAVREGDDSAYGPAIALSFAAPTFKSSTGEDITFSPAGTARMVLAQGGGAGAGTLYPSADGTQLLGTTTEKWSVLNAVNARLSNAHVTVGSGTGVTVNDTGSVRDVVYEVTVTYTNVVSNAVTHDLTIATLPAKTFIKHVVADLTTPFVCAQTCTTATLSATVGSAAGGNQYLLSFDIDAAAAQFGDIAAELGASINPTSVPTMNGALGSWASTSPVSLRITSAVGDLATAGVTNLNAGVITFYITTTKMP